MAILGDVRPSQWPLSHREASREARSDADRHALSSRDRNQRRNRARIDHRVTQTRHEHARPETDALRAFGGTAELNPDVRVQRGGIVKPGPGVA